MDDPYRLIAVASPGYIMGKEMGREERTPRRRPLSFPSTVATTIYPTPLPPCRCHTTTTAISGKRLIQASEPRWFLFLRPRLASRAKKRGVSCVKKRKNSSVSLAGGNECVLGLQLFVQGRRPFTRVGFFPRELPKFPIGCNKRIEFGCFITPALHPQPPTSSPSYE